MKEKEFFEILEKSGYVLQTHNNRPIWFNKETGVWAQESEDFLEVIFARIPDPINKPFSCQVLWAVAYSAVKELKFENGCFTFGDRLSFKV